MSSDAPRWLEPSESHDASDEVRDGMRAVMRRTEQAATTYDYAAGLARVEAAMAVMPQPAPTPQPTAPRARWWLASGLAGLAALGVWYGSRRADRRVAPSALHGGPFSTTAPAAPAATPSASLLGDPPAPALAAKHPTHRHPLHGPPRTPRTSSATIALAAAPPSGDDALRREVALIARANAVLEQEPAQALALMEQGRREFPRGYLAVERDAIEILALARSGARAEARRRAIRYLRGHTNAPRAAAIRRATGLDETR